MVNLSIAWLVFARANSSRLPNKCYKLLKYKNSLQHIVDDICSQGVRKDNIYLATSNHPANQRLLQISQDLEICNIIGQENYPISRIYYNKSILSEYDYVVRICGDSPLYCSSLVIKSIILAQQLKLSPDAITNTRLRNFPSGMSIEIYNTKKLFDLFDLNPFLVYEEHLAKLLNSDSTNGWLIKDLIFTHKIPSDYLVKLTLDTESDFFMLQNLFDSQKAAQIKSYYNNFDFKLS